MAITEYGDAEVSDQILDLTGKFIRSYGIKPNTIFLGEQTEKQFRRHLNEEQKLWAGMEISGSLHGLRWWGMKITVVHQGWLVDVGRVLGDG